VTDQQIKLEALSRAIELCRVPAAKNNLFASRAGFQLVNAMHDLTEVDALYDFAEDVAATAGLPENCEPILTDRTSSGAVISRHIERAKAAEKTEGGMKRAARAVP
jgi:hypothetical protein